MSKFKIFYCLTIVIGLSSMNANMVIGQTQTITVSELRDKIAGAWIGQMVGNIYGLSLIHI